MPLEHRRPESNRHGHPGAQLRWCIHQLKRTAGSVVQKGSGSVRQSRHPRHPKRSSNTTRPASRSAGRSERARRSRRRARPPLHFMSMKFKRKVSAGSAASADAGESPNAPSEEPRDETDSRLTAQPITDLQFVDRRIEWGLRRCYTVRTVRSVVRPDGRKRSAAADVHHTARYLPARSAVGAGSDCFRRRYQPHLGPE